MGGGASRKKIAREGGREHERERKNWFVCVIVGRGGIASRRGQDPFPIPFALERWRLDEEAGSMGLRNYPGRRTHGGLRRVGRLPWTCWRLSRRGVDWLG